MDGSRSSLAPQRSFVALPPDKLGNQYDWVDRSADTLKHFDQSSDSKTDRTLASGDGLEQYASPESKAGIALIARLRLHQTTPHYSSGNDPKQATDPYGIDAVSSWVDQHTPDRDSEVP